LGQIAVAQRHHASLNYLAYFDEKLDLETYLASDPVADPVHLHDCVIPVNAGYGFIVTNRNRAQSLDAPAVELAGYGARHNPEPVNQPDMTTTGVVDAAPTALDKAGIEPDDADFVQAYDDYPIIVAMQLEDIGFCAKGEGGEFVEQTGLRYDEKLPLNTSGGQLSAGQAGVAGGFDGLVEGIRQLQGAAGQRQIPDAARGIVTGVGGIAYGKNLLSSAVAVLERGEP
jgi:acetyl-CoA acetyltransferase